MQFKVVFALTLATLAAAGALPGANTNPNPANPATKSDNTATHQGTKTDQGTKTNQGTNIAPPFPGKGTIGGKECSSGHLRCCKSAESPTAADVAPHLPSGVSASDISGLVGLSCAALPIGAKPADCTLAPVCCTDFSGDVALGCNKVDLSK